MEAPCVWRFYIFNVIDRVKQSLFLHLSSVCRLISAYNSLTDKHLAGYFSNTRIRRHLQRAGLVPEPFTQHSFRSAGGWREGPALTYCINHLEFKSLL